MLSAISLIARALTKQRVTRLMPVANFSSSNSSYDGNDSSTFNQNEIDKFKAMSNDWWNPNGVCKPLHSMNRLRIPFIRDGLINSGIADPKLAYSDKPLKGMKILDVGCGAGIISEALARIGAEVTAIDACQENIDVARNHANLDKQLQNNLNYMCTTVEEHVGNNIATYDAVVASEVIEHVDNPSTFIDKCSTAVKVDGSIFLTTINKSTRSWMFAIIAAENILGLLPKGTHEWDKFISPSDLEDMLSVSGCQTRLVHGMLYLPVLNKWSWIPDVSVNYALHAIKVQ